MEIKKTKKADLENKRSLFVSIGLAVALLVVLSALSYTTAVKAAEGMGQVQEVVVEEEIIPITRQEVKPPPPPPPPPAAVTMLNIVSNDTEIDDELEIDDSEIDEDDVIEIKPVETEKPAETAQVFFVVEDMPEFPGGQLALRKYIAKNLKYPVIAQENGIQGKVYVQFVVSKTGAVTQAKVIRGVDPSLDKEALRVVNTLPKWKPGMQRGKSVAVSYTVPITFVLQ